MQAEVPCLDLRRDPKQDLWTVLAARLDETPPGDAFELVSGQGVEALLATLQRDRPGRYEWWPLEVGPPVWRVLVARRTDDASPMGLYELFTRDHQRMRSLLERTRAAVEAGDRQAAARSFGELCHGLERHARSEENLLFPVFRDSRLRGSEQEIDELVREHREIARMLDEVLQVFSGEERFDQPRAVHTLELLWRRIQTHERKEEHVVLPLCERLLTERERARTVLEAQRNP
jgi:uncharacterized protein (DUF2249 family)/hemerythrin-like domain-containing protein